MSRSGKQVKSWLGSGYTPDDALLDEVLSATEVEEQPQKSAWKESLKNLGSTAGDYLKYGAGGIAEIPGVVADVAGMVDPTGLVEKVKPATDVLTQVGRETREAAAERSPSLKASALRGAFDLAFDNTDDNQSKFDQTVEQLKNTDSEFGPFVGRTLETAAHVATPGTLVDIAPMAASGGLSALTKAAPTVAKYAAPALKGLGKLAVPTEVKFTGQGITGLADVAKQAIDGPAPGQPELRAGELVSDAGANLLMTAGTGKQLAKRAFGKKKITGMKDGIPEQKTVNELIPDAAELTGEQVKAQEPANIKAKTLEDLQREHAEYQQRMQAETQRYREELQSKLFIDDVLSGRVEGISPEMLQGGFETGTPLASAFENWKAANDAKIADITQRAAAEQTPVEPAIEGNYPRSEGVSPEQAARERAAQMEFAKQLEVEKLSGLQEGPIQIPQFAGESQMIRPNEVIEAPESGYISKAKLGPISPSVVESGLKNKTYKINGVEYTREQIIEFLQQLRDQKDAASTPEVQQKSIGRKNKPLLQSIFDKLKEERGSIGFQKPLKKKEIISEAEAKEVIPLFNQLRKDVKENGISYEDAALKNNITVDQAKALLDVIVEREQTSGPLTKAEQALEVFEDVNYRIKKIEEGKDIPVDQSVYHEMAVSQNKAANAVEQFVKEDAKTFIDDMFQTVEKNNDLKIADRNQFLEDLHDVAVVKHAIKYNEIHGDAAAAKTTKDLRSALKEMLQKKTQPYQKALFDAAKILVDFNKETLELGRPRLGDKMVDDLKTMYPDYVPLNRIMSLEGVNETAVVPKGQGAIIRRGKGSNLAIANVVESSLLNRAVALGEAAKQPLFKNITNQLQAYGKDLGVKQVKYNPEVHKPELFGPDTQYLKIQDGGKTRVFKFDDVQLAKVYKGTAIWQLPGMLETLAQVGRVVSSLYTARNPAFGPAMFTADFLSVVSKEGLRSDKLVKTFINQLKSVNFLKDILLGRGRGHELAKMYKQGGGVLATDLYTGRQAILDGIAESMGATPATALGKTKRVAKKVDLALKDWNDRFELASRVAVMEGQLKSGATPNQAVNVAMNAGAPYHMKGKASKYMNFYKWFSQIGISSAIGIARAVKNNPKKAAALALIVLGTNKTLDEVNSSFDPDWRAKVPEYDRDSQIVIWARTPDGKGTYKTFKLPAEIKPYWKMINNLTDYANGDLGIGQAIAEVIPAVLSGYTPIAERVTETVTPSLFQTIVQLENNRTGFGGPVYGMRQEGTRKRGTWVTNMTTSYRQRNPEAAQRAIENEKEIIQMFGPENAGSILFGLMNPQIIDFLGRSYGGGLYQLGSQTSKVLGNLDKGEDIRPSDIPFVNRFVKDLDEDQVQYNMRQFKNRK